MQKCPYFSLKLQTPKSSPVAPLTRKALCEPLRAGCPHYHWKLFAGFGSSDVLENDRRSVHSEQIFFFFFGDRVSLYSPGCPGTHFADQSGLKLRNPPASASQVLGLKVCVTTPGPDFLDICRILKISLSLSLSVSVSLSLSGGM
jgi:hypothetical protein